MDVANLKRRFEAQRSSRATIEAVWDEIERYVMPLAGSPRRVTETFKADLAVWDFTAPLALEHLASSLHGAVTPPTVRWFQRVFADGDLNRDREAREWLDKGTERIWSALLESDFNMEISSGYLEFAGLGNMAITVEPTSEESWEGLDFTAVPIREVFWEEDSRGGVKTFFRCLRWTPVQILDRFGDKGTPQRIKEKAASADGGVEKVDVVFAIFHRDGVPSASAEKLVAPERRPVGFRYFLLETAEGLGDEGGYYEMPAVIGRWGKTAGQSWGYGRGNHAIRSVKYLNAYLEAARAAAEKVIDPPLLSTERGILSNPDMRPGGVTVVSAIDQVKPLESGARFDVSEALIQDMRAEIRRLFKEDDLYLKESPAMTATEVQARRELMDRALGSPLARLQNDVLDPLLRIVQGHLYRAGQLTEAPAIVKQKQAETKIEYLGQLALSQRMDEVARIERAAALVAGLIKSGFPRVSIAFDEIAAAREAFTRLGVPASLLFSEPEVKKRERALAEQQARAAEAETSRMEGEAMQAQLPPAGAGGDLPPVPALSPTGGVA